jgi:hypothetical protein
MNGLLSIERECIAINNAFHDLTSLRHYGLYVITGHYRNGILLSPVIGRDIANWLLTGVKPTR